MITLDQMDKTEFGNPYFGHGIYMMKLNGGWLVMGIGNNSCWIRQTKDAIKYGFEKLKGMK